MAGRVLKPSSALLDVFKAWQGGAVRVQQNEKLPIRLDVILDRPEKNNCLSGAMMQQLGEHAKQISSQENAVVVISGVGKSFCSGADLGLIKDISDQHLGVQMFDYMSSVLAHFHDSPAITIAKIHGHALGGATEICSSTDIRIAHSASKIAFFQSKMGIVPSWGGAEHLERIMGRGRALAAMGRANIMTAEEARANGYVDFVYETDEEAENFIAQVASGGLEVTKAQKAMLNAVKTSVDDQKKVLESVWNGETHRIAIQKQIDAVVKK
uniref:Ethylmalonyl-CoA decarboxylase n=1 Tax=Caenorhabditis japonica TaxID=281687 RepID=A0A8R1DKW3_CAEJA